jgi:hypothetical protein
MKTLTKISFATIAVMVAVSLSSCSVEYRTRHPRPVRHHRVIVVGMVKPTIPVDSVVAELTQQIPVNKASTSNDNKTK